MPAREDARLVVRDAVADDVPHIVALLQQLSRDAAVREADPRDPAYLRAFAAIADDPRQRVLVVVDGARVIATAQMRVFPNLSHQGRPIAQAESVVVDEAARGRGVGALLMAHVEDLARAAGAFRLELTSNAARADAHRFYAKLGYTPSHVGFKKALA